MLRNGHVAEIDMAEKYGGRIWWKWKYEHGSQLQTPGKARQFVLAKTLAACFRVAAARSSELP